MDNFDFSVIVCCYNSDLEKTKKTIISIVKQKGVKVEIIIADDGSEDRTIEQIKTWVVENRLENVRYSFLSENVGTVKNIVIAIKMAKGTYIKTISPGDYLFDEFSLKRYLNKFNQGHYQLLFSKAVYYTQEGKIKKTYNPVATGTKYKLFRKKNLCQFCDGFLGATVAYHRDALKYLEELIGVVRLLEDYPLTYLMLMSHEKVGFINKNLIWYECNTGVSTTEGGARIATDFANFFNYLETKYQDNKRVKKIVKFLRYLRIESRNKIFLCFVKPSYFFFLVDRLITRFCRKIGYAFKKIKISWLDNITML